MNNNPFLPPAFKDTVPKGQWNTYTGPQEDGPSNYTNPANSTTLVRYNGQDQIATIVNSAVKPPTLRLPGAAVGMSKIP